MNRLCASDCGHTPAEASCDSGAALAHGPPTRAFSAHLLAGAAAVFALAAGAACAASDPVCVLTFDDASASHARTVAPLLKQYAFGATFFVCEFGGFENKANYMSWAEIAQLSRDGFEIGNHTLTHAHVGKLKPEQLAAELAAIEARCASNGIPRPVSFAYPGYATNAAALDVLRGRGYRWARAGGGRACRPGLDNPLLLPSVSGSGEKPDRLLTALGQARPGEVVIVTFHGVPDLAHPQVGVPPETFKVYLDYLRDHHYRVIALRDLETLLPGQEPATRDRNGTKL